MRLAISQTGTSAPVAKKNANGVVITVNTPEPATAVLALLRLVGLAASRRR
jgi:hypothetical protein